MKNIAFVLFIFVLLFCCVPVSAATTALNFKNSEGLYGLLLRSGCRGGWLPIEMMENNIERKDLRFLRRDRPIMVDLEVCVLPPSDEMREETAAILAADKAPRRRRIASVVVMEVITAEQLTR